MKKILAMLLVFAMAITMVPMTMVGSALAADEVVNSYEMSAASSSRSTIYLKTDIASDDEISFYVYIGGSSNPSGLSMYARGNGTKATYKGSSEEVYSGKYITGTGHGTAAGEEGSGWYYIECVAQAACPSSTGYELSVDGTDPGTNYIAGIKVNGVEVSSSVVYASNKNDVLTAKAMNIPTDLKKIEVEEEPVLPSISGMTVSVGQDITVNCYAKDITEEYDNVFVKFIANGEDVEVTGTATEVEGEYVFKYTDLLPEQMGDNITMELYADGQLFSTKTTTVENYLNGLKTPAGDAIKLEYDGTSTGRMQFYYDDIKNAAGDTIELVVKLPVLQGAAVDSVRIRLGSSANTETDVNKLTLAAGAANGKIQSLGDDWYKIIATVPENAAETETVCVTIYYSTDVALTGQAIYLQSLKVVGAGGVTAITSENIAPEEVRDSVATVDTTVTVPGPTALDKLINDMLVYGGAAQNYRDYNTNDLVSEGVTGTTFVAPNSTDKNSTSTLTGYEFISANLWFDYANKIIFKFQAADTANLAVKINGTQVDYEDLGNGTYRVETDAISALQFDKVYTASIEVDGDEVASATYSVNSYVYSKGGSNDAELAALVKALYNYGLSAKAIIAED